MLIPPRFVPKLKKLGIRTPRELLYHFPARYDDYSRIYKISELKPDKDATVSGEVLDISLRQARKRRKLTIVEALISDDSGTISAVWFNQPYLRRVLAPGTRANFAGRPKINKGRLYLPHPTFEIIPRDSASDSASFRDTRHTARIVPVYPETRGFTSKGIRFLIKPLLQKLTLEEFIPGEVIAKRGLPEINKALRNIHFPETMEDAEKARERFVFEELFLLQLWNELKKEEFRKSEAPKIEIKVGEIKKTIGKLPFELTAAQKKTLQEITRDLGKATPMNRLLQGDVGSGKTIVAALAAREVASSEFQATFMAPTEILARQHYETLKKTFPEFDKGIALLTSSEAKVYLGPELETNLKKSELTKRTAEGKFKIIVGTHALIQKTVKFANLGLVIIDEQHRFGVKQRAALIRDPKNPNPSELSEKQQGKIIEKELSYKLNGIFFEIQHKLGRFCREKQYQDALEQNLKEKGINFEREKPIEVAGVKSNFADFIVENKVIIEVKTKSFIEKEDYYQISRYLEAAKMELGIIVNFRQEHLKPKRVLNPRIRRFGSFGSGSGHSGRYIPHFLSMSATPIPRTLSLILFGDLDLSLINELPKNRKETITKVVAPENRDKAYAFIRGQVKKGRQVFVICPRIEESETLNDARQRSAYRWTSDATRGAADKRLTFSEQLVEVKSVKREYEKLFKHIFPDLKVAMLHGRMKSKEKEKIMTDFANGQTDLLISTSVVEVGVDVPNATIMMIEGAERFGLAQLYQFRGRVGRGEHQSFCFLFTDSSLKTAAARLSSIVSAKNGFELAEKDLKLRGPGEFFGTAQTGVPDLAMKALKNPETLKAAREEARGILEHDPTLQDHPNLRERLENFRKEVHRE